MTPPPRLAVVPPGGWPVDPETEWVAEMREFRKMLLRLAGLVARYLPEGEAEVTG